MWLLFVLGGAISILTWFIKQNASFAMEYPIAFAITVIVLYATYWIYATNRHRAYTRKMVSKSRTIAYDKLVYESEHGSNTYAILHLREDVAQTLYPDSLKKRKEFMKNVWPRVVTELKNDVRIQQCQKTVGGVALECWMWLGNKGSSTSTPAAAKKRSDGHWNNGSSELGQH